MTAEKNSINLQIECFVLQSRYYEPFKALNLKKSASRVYRANLNSTRSREEQYATPTRLKFSTVYEPNFEFGFGSGLHTFCKIGPPSEKLGAAYQVRSKRVVGAS